MEHIQTKKLTPSLTRNIAITVAEDGGKTAVAISGEPDMIEGAMKRLGGRWMVYFL